MVEQDKKDAGDGAAAADVDIVHEIWGDIGRYPLFINVLISLMNVSVAWQMLSMPFLAPKTEFWCAQPGETRGLWSERDWVNLTHPRLEGGDLDRCNVYDHSHLLDGRGRLRPDFDEQYQLMVSSEPVPCSNFEHDTSFWASTAVSKWDLVCSRAGWAKSYSNSLFMSGVATGVFASGLASDRWGRRPVLFALMALKSATGAAAALLDSFGAWLAVRWVTYASAMSLMSVKYVLSMEVLSGQHRVTFGMGMLVTYALGIVAFPFVAYWLRDFSKIQLAMSLANAIFLPLYFVIPESPRWLVAHGRFKEAQTVLERGARFMGGEGLPEKFDLEEMVKRGKKKQEEGPKPNLWSLFKTGRLRRYTLAMYLIWFTHGFVYYGIGLNIGNIGGDLFVNYFIFGLVDVPGFLFTVVVLTYCRRRPSNLGFMFACGGCLLGTCLFGKGDYPGDWPIVALAMVGKFCLTITFTSLYLYTVEIFPTLVRNVGLGSSSTFARLGSIAAPLTFGLHGLHERFFPTGLLGLVFLLSALATAALPETHRRALPATIGELEASHDGRNGGCGSLARDCCCWGAAKEDSGGEEEYRLESKA